MKIYKEDKFDTLNLVKNHLNDNASFNNCMFETYGEELAYVNQIRKNHPNKILTIIDVVENGKLVVTTGYHFVNRIGYLISKEDINEEFEIILD